MNLGRFREFYYWDTYWIIKALLHCDMSTTVKGILENFLLMVSTYGLVPNGGRIYYTKRSRKNGKFKFQEKVILTCES